MLDPSIKAVTPFQTRVAVSFWQQNLVLARLQTMIEVLTFIAVNVAIHIVSRVIRCNYQFFFSKNKQFTLLLAKKIVHLTLKFQQWTLSFSITSPNNFTISRHAMRCFCVTNCYCYASAWIFNLCKISCLISPK